MNTFYQILGLEPGASQLEIKKAYFKLIRQHSPESDPEQFQKIREAYEQLKNAGEEPQGPVFAPLSEPFAEKMMEQVENCRRRGDSVKYRDTAEEAWKLFPEDVQFLYHLIIAQRQCGNTGKAVKNAELLVKKDSRNKWYQRELAVSYIERGFTQKAYWACEAAYRLGCRDLDFVLMYARECLEYSEFDTGRQILSEAILQEKRWKKEEIPELVEAHCILLEIDAYDDTEGHFSKAIELLTRTVEQYSLYMEEFIPELSLTINRCIQWFIGPEEYSKFGDLIAVLRKSARTEEAGRVLDKLRGKLEFLRIKQDSKCSEVIKRLYERYYFSDTLSPIIKRFALLDCWLCMIEEREAILQQAEWIALEYPDFYEEIRIYIDELQDKEKIGELKDKLQRSYRQLEPDISGGYYYKEYPQEKIKAKGILISDGATEQPYVRAGKKIGRNEPCPCGSGKKYKNCCMKK